MVEAPPQTPAAAVRLRGGAGSRLKEQETQQEVISTATLSLL